MSLLIGGVVVEVDRDTMRWTGGLEVDADGSPRAYAPPDSGLHALDALANAGEPGRWYGIVCRDNEPVVQDPDDPAPGYYVSPTALSCSSYARTDPRAYVDSESVPFVSVPPELLRAGARLGDLCVVQRGDIRVGAICADVGPSHHLGEGSIALHQALGLDPFRGLPRHHLLGIDGGVSVTLYLDSARAPRWPVADVSRAALEFAASRG